MAGLRIGCFMRTQLDCHVKSEGPSAACRLTSSDSQRSDIGIAIIPWRQSLQSCAERCQRRTIGKCSSLPRGQCIESSPAATVDPAVQHGEQGPAVRPAMLGLVAALADCPCMPAEFQTVDCDTEPGAHQICARSMGRRTQAELIGQTCIRTKEHHLYDHGGMQPTIKSALPRLLQDKGL